MFPQQQFVKIHVCSKRKGKLLKYLFVHFSKCKSVCVCLFVCASLLVSVCVSAINLCVNKYDAFVLRILLVPVLVLTES